VFLADDILIGMDWLLSNAVGGVKIQALELEAERAAKFVEQYSRDPLEKSRTLHESDIDVKCEECGQTTTFGAESRGGVEVCPHGRVDGSPVCHGRWELFASPFSILTMEGQLSSSISRGHC
jgi:hypothetical protein